MAKRAPYKFVEDVSMSCSAGAASAGEAVSYFRAYTSAAWVLMRLAEFGCKTQAHRYLDRLVVQSQTA